MSAVAGACDAGYYCPENQVVPNPNDYLCPRGHFCPTGSTEPQVPSHSAVVFVCLASACYLLLFVSVGVLVFLRVESVFGVWGSEGGRLCPLFPLRNV